MDSFKKYLQENKEKFDNYSPREMVQDGLFAKLAAKRKKRLYRFIGYSTAAAIAGIFLISIFIGKNDSQEEVTHRPGTQMRPPAVAKTIPSGDTTKIAYTARIDAGTKKKNVHPRKQTHRGIASPAGNEYEQALAIQWMKIRRTPVYAENREYFASFSRQVKELDEYEEILRTEDPGQMTLIYRQKLALLSDLQYEIDKMNSRIERYGTLHKRTAYFLNFQ